MSLSIGLGWTILMIDIESWTQEILSLWNQSGETQVRTSHPCNAAPKKHV